MQRNEDEIKNMRIGDEERKILNELVGEKFLKMTCSGKSGGAGIRLTTPTDSWIVYFEEIDLDMYETYERIAIKKGDRAFNRCTRFYFGRIKNVGVFQDETTDGLIYDCGMVIETENAKIRIKADYGSLDIENTDELEPFKTKPAGWCEGFREEKKRIGNKDRESTE